PYVGNVFCRAVIANVLADADRGLAAGQLGPCLEHEAGHLLAQRRDGEPGLWAYFPTLPELACDADDLAEGLRLLAHTGHAATIAAQLAAALALALHECALPDGSISTWLIPHTESAWATRQATAAREVWGEQTDPEVVANLLHAAGTYNGRRYQ